MTWWRVLVARCRALVRPQQVRDEIGDELQFHLEMRAREHARQGMSDEEARRAAARTFGSLTNIKEISYDIRGGGLAEALWRDLTYAARSLVKHRGLSATVVAIVAIGVGANAAILGVADRLLWRELPVRAPSELEQVKLAFGLDGISYPLYRTLRREARGFAAVIARWRQASTLVVGAGEPERRVVELVSGNYFATLGVRPFMGRLLTDDDDRALMAHPVVVISDRYWRTRFGGRASAIGSKIVVDDYPFTVVGVALRGFFGVEVGTEPDVWIPLAMHPVVFSAHRSLVDDTWMWLSVLGRRAPEWSPASAQAQATVVSRRFFRAAGEPDSRLKMYDVRLVSAARGLSRLRGKLERPLLVLIGIVGFVLIVACANVGTLVGARAMARGREIGVRLALGASRARVIRQLLIENLLLAVVGGIVGTAFAIGASRALVRLLPTATVPHEIDVSPDGRMLIIALLLSTITGVLFGIAPAFRAVRLDVARVIRDDIRLQTRRRLGVRRTLVAGQVAVSLVLVTGAGLFAKSLDRLASVPAGFDASHVLMATISPTLNRYTPQSAVAFYRALQSRLSAAPGVRSVATSAAPVLGGEDNYNITTLHWSGQRRRSDPFSLLAHTVSGDFFAATGVQILRGRGLDNRDIQLGSIAIVLNETAARYYFDDVDPVGKSVKLMANTAMVVGVARDSKYRTMREAMPQIIYTTFEQDTGATVSLDRTLYVRTDGDPAALAATLESAVRELDRSLPLYDVRTMTDQQRRSLATERAVALLSALAAGIALLLAAIGLYGLMAYDTQQRTREIGVRISLGATNSSIMTLVLRGALGLLLIGGVAGLALARGLSSVVAAQLYGVSASDATVTLIACVALAAAVFIAASVPAWRASRVNPVEALRYE
jgi:predicted permease